MPLPTPNLDNRRFQDIVDEAKRLIPQYCPEWTAHNVSDPGVALLELFAWMVELLLYRVNQVPDKCYVKFLEMIGVRLQPPTAAEASVTFYLSAPQETVKMIERGTETGTARTETSPSIIFTTQRDLSIRPPRLKGVFTAPGSGGKWVPHDLGQLGKPMPIEGEGGYKVIVFPIGLAVDDAFYFAFADDHSHHVLSLGFGGCEPGPGVDPRRPPIEWQVWQGEGWEICDLERDGTGGFSVDGEVLVHLPQMAEGEHNHLRAYWLRCRLTDAQTVRPRYEQPPAVTRSIRVESVGGAVRARHAVSVLNEVVGQSDGTPGQVFKLLNAPVLARTPETDHLEVRALDGSRTTWREVQDFAESRETDLAYMLDETDGTLMFGPALLQPDGTIFRFGAVPPKGSTLCFTRYEYGGGAGGNVPRGAISSLKKSVSYIRGVTNRRPSEGGRDAQSLEDGKLRAAQQLRSRSRAVTAEDFEIHTCRVPGIARARCLAPGSQPGPKTAARPGSVFVIVLPEIKPESRNRPAAAELALSAELREEVKKTLDERKVLGVEIEVKGATVTYVSVHADLHLVENTERSAAEEAVCIAEQTLYRFINPYLGGSRGEGWPFGRSLHVSEIYSLLQRVPYVQFVDNLRVLYGPKQEQAPSFSVEIESEAVFASGVHKINIR